MSDIERLWLCKSNMDLATERPHWCRGMGHDGCGWRFLVPLADQDGDDLYRPEEARWWCDNDGDTRCRGPVEQAELNETWPRSRPHELCRWVRLVPVESEDRDR